MELQNTHDYSDVTQEIIRLARLCEKAGAVDPELYTKYDVKRGLRDLNGKGVLAGLTSISNVQATQIVDGVSVPAHGKLYYRGYDVEDLVRWMKITAGRPPCSGKGRMLSSVPPRPIPPMCAW